MATICVACCIPQGLNIGGITLNKAVISHKQPDGGEWLAPGGWSYTEMDAEIWARWAKENERSPLVLNGFVMAHADRNELRRMVRESGARRSGFEQAKHA